MMNISVNVKQNSFKLALHEYWYLLRAQHIHIVCLEYGWFWINNI